MSTQRQSFTGALIGGRYRLGRELGRGGMGSVYDAVQENLGRRVAVKVVLPELAEDAEVLARFRREAEVAASLGHPNIVQVTDFGHAPGEPAFLVMELLSGESLRARIQRESMLDPALVISLAMQILSALGAAHRAGIVHRDLKPDNVFLVEMPGLGSLAKLLDFGIAKLAESKGYARLTATGVIIGTPTYMAPEQMAGGPIDARTDLYALGVVMYRALAGRPPFAGKAPADILRAILAGEGTPLESVRPDLDPRLVSVIACAMHREPAMRFASADDMRAALELLATRTSAPSNPRVSHPSPAVDTGAWSTGRSPHDTQASGLSFTAHGVATSSMTNGFVPATSQSAPIAAAPSLPATSLHLVPAQARTSSRVRRSLAVIAVLGVSAIALAAWLALGSDEPPSGTSVTNAAAAAPTVAPLAPPPIVAAPSAPRVMSSLGSLSPPVQVGSLRLEVSAVYAAHYRTFAELETPVRSAASIALACLVRVGYRATSVATFAWAISVDNNGRVLGSTASEPGRDLRVGQCLEAGARAVQLPSPWSGTPTSIGVETRIFAD